MVCVNRSILMLRVFVATVALSLVLAAGALAAGPRSRAALADPSANRPLDPASAMACAADPSGGACVNGVLHDINAARAAEGVGPMVLPSDFRSLNVGAQLLAVSNIERVDRGLQLVLGLSRALDQDAAASVRREQDPVPSAMYGDAWSANWEGGYPSALEADYVWMYDDGYGSGNLDCRSPGAAGCWGHRHDILASFASPVVMGAASGTGAFGPALDELFVGGDARTAAGQPDAPLSPTWSAIAHTLPLAVAPAAVRLARRGRPVSVRVFASGEPMTVTASIVGVRGAWSVTPVRCAIAPGASCVFRVAARAVSASAAGAGHAGALLLDGPNGSRTVRLLG